MQSGRNWRTFRKILLPESSSSSKRSVNWTDYTVSQSHAPADCTFTDMRNWNLVYVCLSPVLPGTFSRIRSTKSPSFWVSQTLSSSYLRHMIAEIPAPSMLRLQKHTDIRAHDFGLLSPLPRFVDVPYASSWRLYGINPVAPYSYRPLLYSSAVASLVTKIKELFWLFLWRQPLPRLPGRDISRK
jgi:hypothetical protein